MEFAEHQFKAVCQMKNGCILNGGVGSGKTRTALAYYYLQNGGDISFLTGGEYVDMDKSKMKDLYIITTARKRDTREWDSELGLFLLFTKNVEYQYYANKVCVDSWNNIKKYNQVSDSFFIFDEDKVTGGGVWAKTFLQITRHNEWIVLSATPGDKWIEYATVFIANRFYRNITQFKYEHVLYSPYQKYRITGYMNEKKLRYLRDQILIDMDYKKRTTAHHEYITCDYDHETYKQVMATRKNIQTGEPCINAADLCLSLRYVVNTDKSRISKIKNIYKKFFKIIIFYNFNYELNILKNIDYGSGVSVAEWNGHAHQDIPDTDKWVYLVQYNAGAEGWNCIKTNVIIFYSQTYSYKGLIQACGRIDRFNTPYTDLYYYHLLSFAPIDRAIRKALDNKKKFNEGKFIKW